MPDPKTPGTNGQNEDEGGDAPSFVTEEKVAQIVNAAVTAQLKRSLSKEIGAALTAALEPIKAELTKVATPPEPDKKDEKGKPPPEVAALQKQLDDMKAALRAKDEEAASERKNAREEKAYASLVSELTGKVRPGAERMVATLLKAQGQLLIDDEGKPTLKVRTTLAKGQPEEDHEFPIADGVGHFVKTKDAALFLPPPNQGGAGGDRRVPPQTANGQRSAPRIDPNVQISDEEIARRTAEQFAAQGLTLGDL